MLQRRYAGVGYYSGFSQRAAPLEVEDTQPFAEYVQNMNYTLTLGSMIVGAAFLTACGMHQFSGNGTLVDHGYWSRFPRYEVSLTPAISLTADLSHSYRFSGMPRDPLSLTFLVTPFVTEADIRANVAALDVDLRSEGGSSLCSFRTTLAVIRVNQVRDEAAGAVGARSLWDRACLDIRFNPKLSYQLTVKVSGITPSATAAYRLVPQFSGGGHELP
jgi:hypothetical protein